MERSHRQNEDNKTIIKILPQQHKLQILYVKQAQQKRPSLAHRKFIEESIICYIQNQIARNNPSDGT